MDDVISRVTGYVTYDVRVECPHCNHALSLNQSPYDDDSSEYRPAEDELGRTLFGSITEVAKWDQLGIKYNCCACEKEFILNALEI